MTRQPLPTRGRSERQPGPCRAVAERRSTAAVPASSSAASHQSTSVIKEPHLCQQAWRLGVISRCCPVSAGIVGKAQSLLTNSTAVSIDDAIGGGQSREG